jgi:hypothetical protein
MDNLSKNFKKFTPIKVVSVGNVPRVSIGAKDTADLRSLAEACLVDVLIM